MELSDRLFPKKECAFTLTRYKSGLTSSFLYACRFLSVGGDNNVMKSVAYYIFLHISELIGTRIEDRKIIIIRNIQQNSPNGLLVIKYMIIHNPLQIYHGRSNISILDLFE